MNPSVATTQQIGSKRQPSQRPARTSPFAPAIESLAREQRQRKAVARLQRAGARKNEKPGSMIK